MQNQTTSGQTRRDEMIKEESFRERWQTMRPSKTLYFWSLVATVALTMFIGFNWGGWMTASAAQEMANDSSENAVIQALAPICVAQFNMDPERDQHLIDLQEASSYQRDNYIKEQLWATMPGAEESINGVARECARLLMQESEA
jgi:hypothetical protein